MNSTLEKFALDIARKQYPLVEAMFKISQIAPKDLVGRQVTAIRGGFSSANGGRKMIVTRLAGWDNSPEAWLELEDVMDKSKKFCLAFDEIPFGIVLSEDYTF